jgi:hypothetical protein
MSCDCGKCREHYRTLGIAYGIPSEVEIEEAYREGVKEWNPSLYENYASLRAGAEEHFKQIQIAYRELNEHNRIAVESPPETLPLEIIPADSFPPETLPPEIIPADSFPPETLPVESIFKIPEDKPTISFGGAPGCLVASQFTTEVEEIVARYLGKTDTALAIIDLDGARSYASYSHFLLLAARGIMMRDARDIVSLLWYKDLGEVNLIDKRKSGKLSFSQMLLGSQHNYSLEIFRNDGNHYFSITNQVDDNVKIVIYNFLWQQKTQVGP